MDDGTRLRRHMEDAGCDESSIASAEALLSAGEREELVCCLRRCRSDQLEELHRRQKQLDCLDLLIRSAQNMT